MILVLYAYVSFECAFAWKKYVSYISIPTNASNAFDLRRLPRISCLESTKKRRNGMVSTETFCTVKRICIGQERERRISRAGWVAGIPRRCPHRRADTTLPPGTSGSRKGPCKGAGGEFCRSFGKILFVFGCIGTDLCE